MQQDIDVVLVDAGPGQICENSPLLPGTRTIYSSSGSSFFCVGFRGYAGGFDAMGVMDDRERASTGPWVIVFMPWFGGAEDERESPSTATSTLAIYGDIQQRACWFKMVLDYSNTVRGGLQSS